MGGKLRQGMGERGTPRKKMLTYPEDKKENVLSKS